MADKQSSQELSSLAAVTLNAGKPEWMPANYWDNVVKRLAGSVLSQDETPDDPPPNILGAG